MPKLYEKLCRYEQSHTCKYKRLYRRYANYTNGYANISGATYVNIKGRTEVMQVIQRLCKHEQNHIGRCNKLYINCTKGDTNISGATHENIQVEVGYKWVMFQTQV